MIPTLRPTPAIRRFRAARRRREAETTEIVLWHGRLDDEITVELYPDAPPQVYVYDPVAEYMTTSLADVELTAAERAEAIRVAQAEAIAPCDGMRIVGGAR